MINGGKIAALLSRPGVAKRRGEKKRAETFQPLTKCTTKNTKENARGADRRASQRRRGVVVGVVPHLQRRPPQRAALHADQLHPLDTLLRSYASGRVFLAARVQTELHVAPVDDADGPVVVARLVLATRPELTAHLGVGRRARGDRRRRQHADRPRRREHLVAEGTAQVPHPEDLASDVACDRRVRGHRGGGVSRRRHHVPQVLQVLKILARHPLRDRDDAFRPRGFGEIVAGRVDVAAVARVVVAAGPLVVVTADSVA